jgi:hypothetical protein
MKSLALACIILLLIPGCQRDDLCGENFQVTPKLNIEFYDIAEPEELKSYGSLRLINDEIGDTLDIEGGNDTSIPLATNADQTTFRFIKNINSNEPQEDTVRFNYSRRNEYVNRACGFKIEYVDLQVQIIDNDERWIKNTNVRKSVIRSDENIHLFMFH